MNRTLTFINRNFVLAFCAQLALMSVYQLLIPTLPLHLKRMGSSEIEVGILVGIMGIASVVARPLTGRALVKGNARTFMMVGACFYVASSAAYLVAPPLLPLLCVRIIQGAAFGMFHTASTSYVVDISEPGFRARVLAYFALTMNFAGTVAPPLGVVLLNKFGSSYLFVACTSVALCTLVASSVLGHGQTAKPYGSTKDRGPLLSRAALPHSLVGFMALWIWASLTTFFPIYATNQGIANPGIFFTTIAVTLIASRTLGGRILDVFSKRSLVFPCLLTSVLSMIVLSLSRTQPLFLLSAVLWAAGHAFLIPSLMTLALERAGSASSPVVATFYAVSDLGVFIGPLVMGVVAHYISYPVMFFCLSVVGMINVVYFGLFTRQR
jgi:predicted MFS family arabinose efflux permease